MRASAHAPDRQRAECRERGQETLVVPAERVFFRTLDREDADQVGSGGQGYADLRYTVGRGDEAGVSAHVAHVHDLARRRRGPGETYAELGPETAGVFGAWSDADLVVEIAVRLVVQQDVAHAVAEGITEEGDRRLEEYALVRGRQEIFGHAGQQELSFAAHQATLYATNAHIQVPARPRGRHQR